MDLEVEIVNHLTLAVAADLLVRTTEPLHHIIVVA